MTFIGFVQLISYSEILNKKNNHIPFLSPCPVMFTFEVTLFVLPEGCLSSTCIGLGLLFVFVEDSSGLILE